MVAKEYHKDYYKKSTKYLQYKFPQNNGTIIYRKHYHNNLLQKVPQNIMQRVPQELLQKKSQNKIPKIYLKLQQEHLKNTI